MVEILAKIILIIWGFLAFIVIFFDLQISILVVDTHSPWGLFVYTFGEIPGYIVLIFALLIYFRVHMPSKPVKKTFFALIILIALIYLLYAVEQRLLENVVPFNDSKSFFLVLTTAFSAVLLILWMRIDIQLVKNYDYFARVTLLLGIINPLLFVQIVKIIWGRVRFRNLAPDYSNYSPWYIPQGITGNKSFPSGHTAMGWMLLPLMLLTKNKGKKTHYTIGIVIIFWGLVVALGRVVIGAHYASDILFSSGMALVSFVLLQSRYYPKTRKTKIDERN